MSRNTLFSMILLSTLIAAPVVGFTTGEATLHAAGQYATDTEITTKVKAELAKDTGLKGFDVHVTTHHRKVQLSGFVKDQQTIDKAIEIAKSVKDVESVESSLQIK